jgi:hypothetical protein
MKYIPRLQHCYELWKIIREKLEEVIVYTPEMEDWLEETMNEHIVETKDSVFHDIDNCLAVIALYERKKTK